MKTTDLHTFGCALRRAAYISEEKEQCYAEASHQFTAYLQSNGWQAATPAQKQQLLTGVLLHAPLHTSMRHALGLPTASPRVPRNLHLNALPPELSQIWQKVDQRVVAQAILDSSPAAEASPEERALDARQKLWAIQKFPDLLGERPALPYEMDYLTYAAPIAAEASKVAVQYHRLWLSEPSIISHAAFQTLSEKIPAVLEHLLIQAYRYARDHLEGVEISTQHLESAGKIALLQWYKVARAYQTFCRVCEENPPRFASFAQPLDALYFGLTLVKFFEVCGRPRPADLLLTPPPICLAEERDELQRSIRFANRFRESTQGIFKIEDLDMAPAQVRKIISTAQTLLQRSPTTCPLPSYIFYGTTGCGKSYLIDGLSASLGFIYYKPARSDLTSCMQHETAGNIRRLYRGAQAQAERENTYALIFLDEIDSYLNQRLKQDRSEHSDNVNQLLTMLCGGQTKAFPRVITFGATNRYDDLDGAAKRRFNSLHIGLPDHAERQAVFRFHIKNRRLMAKMNDAHITEMANLSTGCHCGVISDAVRQADIPENGTMNEIANAIVSALASGLAQRQNEMIRWTDDGFVLDTEVAEFSDHCRSEARIYFSAKDSIWSLKFGGDDLSMERLSGGQAFSAVEIQIGNNVWLKKKFEAHGGPQARRYYFSAAMLSKSLPYRFDDRVFLEDQCPQGNLPIKVSCTYQFSDLAPAPQAMNVGLVRLSTERGTLRGGTLSLGGREVKLRVGYLEGQPVTASLQLTDPLNHPVHFELVAYEPRRNRWRILVAAVEAHEKKAEFEITPGLTSVAKTLTSWGMLGEGEVWLQASNKSSAQPFSAWLKKRGYGNMAQATKMHQRYALMRNKGIQ